jgi:hypothetical protein
MADSAGLVTKIELSLRRSGIHVTEGREAPDASVRFEVLAVPVAQAAGTLGYAISTRMYLQQWLYHVGKGVPNLLALAQTWESSEVLVLETDLVRDGRLAKVAEDMADEFANDWLAAHSK